MAPLLSRLGVGGGSGFGFGKRKLASGGSGGGGTYDVMPILNTTSDFQTVTSGVREDSFASSLVLALPMATSSGLNLTDQFPSGRSTDIKTVSNTGVAAVSSPSKFYGGSAEIFDTDKLNITYAGTDFTFGTSTDFTIECWTYITSGHFFGRIVEIGTVNTNAFVLDGNGPGGATTFRLRYDHIASSSYSGYDINLNTWHHVAAVRNSGTLTFYVDGVQSGSTADLSSSNLPGGSMQIGNYLGSNLDYDGYITDLRVYKGLAKYTSEFTVPP
jgi:hypothetical protein